MMLNNLLDQLKICSATSSLQNLFAVSSYSYKIFFPDIQLKDNKRTLLDKGKQNDPENKKRKAYGSIINKTNKRITFPKGMEKRYCAAFLGTNNHCPYGNKCNLVHALFPGGFLENDRALMVKHVQDTEGLASKTKM